MKRLIALLLSLVLCFSLCACGAKDNSVTKKDENGNETNETTDVALIDDDNATIEFNDVVLIDDDNVTIELANFYSEDVNWSEGKQNEKCVTFKTTNKTNHEIVINPGKFYLNDEETFVSMIDGSMCPAPGKSGKYSFYVGYKDAPGHKALESLDVLYDLEGSFDILNVYEDSKKNNSYEAEFSIKAVLNPNETKTEQENEQIYSLDDTISTDVVEFKITKNEFANKVAFGTYETYYRPTTETKGLTAGEDKTFFAFTFEIKNISSSKIAESDVCGGNIGDKMALIYDSKYEFNNGFFSDSVLLKDSALAYIDPLETREMRGLIKCASEVADAADKPLYLDVVLPTSSGEKTFRYSIR